MKVLRLVLAGFLTITFVAAEENLNPVPVIIVNRTAIEDATATYPGTTNNLFTANHDGLFRISYYLEVPPSATGTVCLFVGWTDSLKVHQASLPCAGATEGKTAVSATLVVRAKAGTAVTYNFFLANSGSGAATYSAFLVVERLGQ